MSATIPPFQALILAAGKGTRMKSSRIKVMHELLGHPILEYSVRAALETGAERVVLIVGHDREVIEAWLDQNVEADRYHIAVQEEQLGTGHAVWSAREFLHDGPEHTLILSGDVPNMTAATLTRFVQDAVSARTKLSVMSSIIEGPHSYGRMVRDDDGALTRIVEHKDATEQERAIAEVNAGFYFAESSFLAAELDSLCSGEADNAQSEYYLTDLVARAAEEQQAYGWPHATLAEFTGVNDRTQLAQATTWARERINQAWMRAGVTMLDPARVFIEPGVTLEHDVTLYPDVHLEGDTHVARDVVVEQGTTLRDAHIGAGTHIKAHCYVQDARVGEQTNLGPFAHLRPGSDVGSRCKVGNFVEIKKTKLADGAKASHLTYLGDAEVGEDANIGAGTITCNYDGFNKNITRIGKGAFIGSNSALVAPVTIHDGAYVGAGSTITKEIPAGALGVARGRQKNIEGWVKRWHNKNE